MILNIDCRDGFALFPDNSVDAIVTDPPYELGFMGKQWDSSGISYDVALWQQAFRVLKPGGYLLAFGGSRTYHRIVCAIEDAGFEIRDSIMWIYGSGFPKSHNLPDGRGTGLKPAHEPICMARKPLISNVAMNVAIYNTGVLNIDACRVPIDPEADAKQLRTMSVSKHHGNDGWGMNTKEANPQARVLGMEGRWPANVIHDGSEAVIEAFPNAPGQQSAVTGNEPTVNGFSGPTKFGGNRTRTSFPEPRGDAGSAARFFYCAKASKSEKGKDNAHPTVKPLQLMRYLCKLVTPPGGLVVDPFAGSGSTGVAAILEGFQFTGFELDAAYVETAMQRLHVAYSGG